MVKVTLEGRSGAVRIVEFLDGGALVDACDTSGADVPFSCRSASCGTCRVVVLEGGSLLTEAEDEELQVLDAFGVTPRKQRLACQARVASGTGLVHLRAVRDDE